MSDITPVVLSCSMLGTRGTEYKEEEVRKENGTADQVSGACEMCPAYHVTYL